LKNRRRGNSPTQNLKFEISNRRLFEPSASATGVPSPPPDRDSASRQSAQHKAPGLRNGDGFAVNKIVRHDQVRRAAVVDPRPERGIAHGDAHPTDQRKVVRPDSAEKIQPIIRGGLSSHSPNRDIVDIEILNLQIGRDVHISEDRSETAHAGRRCGPRNGKEDVEGIAPDGRE